MENFIRIGTIGNGFIAEEFIDAVNQVDGSLVEAVYLRPEDKVCGFEKKVGVQKVYTSVEEMLKDKTINFIYIAVPNSLHYARAKQALLAGKNVIVEKPFSSNSVEAKELLKLAKTKNLFIFEAISIIHMPNFKALRPRIQDLGVISLVVANYSQHSDKYEKLLQGEVMNVFNPAFSTGCLMDLNYYNVYSVIALFGKPKRVTYYAKEYSNGIDVSGIVTMQYDDFNAVCVGAKDCSGKNSFQVQGNRGYICVDEGINGVREVNVRLLSENTSEVINNQSIDNRLYYEVESFVDFFRNRDYDACYKLLDCTIEVLEVIEECLDQIGIHYVSPSYIET